jgi:acetyl esterase/lipase
MMRRCSIWAVLIPLSLLTLGCGSPAEEGPAGTDEPPPAVALWDADGDGKLSSEEIPPEPRRVLLHAIDADSDGVLNAAELATMGRGGAGRGRSRGKEPLSWEAAEEELDGVRVLRNIDYASGPEWSGGRGKLDLYLPLEGADFPVLVFFHGGALFNGDKAKLTPLGVRFVNLGYIVACPNYRLAPEWYFPAYVEDAAAAFRWVWDNIESHGGDRQRITVSGGSAGGHITGLLSLDDQFLEAQGLSINDIKVSIPITGMMDATLAGEGRIAITYQGDMAQAEAASPIRHARDDAPPMLLMVADGDTEQRRQENIRMFEAVKEAGHPALEFQMLVDRTHGSIFPNMYEPGDPTVEFMLAFMKEHGAGVE